jgi:hypothetical protein
MLKCLIRPEISDQRVGFGIVIDDSELGAA